MVGNRVKLIILTLALTVASSAGAQDKPKRKGRVRRGVAQEQPGRPPVLDQDFDDATDDEFEPAEQPNQAGQTPGTGQTPPPPLSGAPPPDLRPNTPVAGGSQASKLRFKVVEGEFFEKGKRRGRATDAKKSQKPETQSY